MSRQSIPSVLSAVKAQSIHRGGAFQNSPAPQPVRESRLRERIARLREITEQLGYAYNSANALADDIHGPLPEDNGKVSAALGCSGLLDELDQALNSLDGQVSATQQAVNRLSDI